MKKNTLGVESVNKALEILNCFTDNNEVLTVTKIANITGDHKSRISRISKSLENYGYIRKIKSGEFKIGHSISRLYEIYESSYNLKNSINSKKSYGGTSFDNIKKIETREYRIKIIFNLDENSNIHQRKIIIHLDNKPLLEVDRGKNDKEFVLHTKKCLIKDEYSDLFLKYLK